MAETANSRTRIRPPGKATPTWPTASRPTMAPATRALSAMGSRIAPSMLVAFSLRASQPSKKSVTAATAKAMNAQLCRCRRMAGPISANGAAPAAAVRNSSTSKVSTSRPQVRMLGKARIGLGLSR